MLRQRAATEAACATLGREEGRGGRGGEWGERLRANSAKEVGALVE